MAGLGQRRRTGGDLDCEIDMVPIMNMFLVLIPFLLASSSFLNLKAINTSVPVMAETSTPMEQDKKSEVKITATVKLKMDRIVLEATSSELTEKKLKEMDAVVKKDSQGKYAYAQLAVALLKVKQLYPKSDTLILVPSDGIIYDSIIKTMDVARTFEGQKLFPNVVISGQVQ
ncbi:MAG: biopolymer transporter ExbD [Bermanella sp.]